MAHVELCVGCRVTLVGLVSRPELNDQEATVLFERDGRWAVQCIASSESVRVKLSNLQINATPHERLTGDSIEECTANGSSTNTVGTADGEDSSDALIAPTADQLKAAVTQELASGTVGSKALVTRLRRERSWAVDNRAVKSAIEAMRAETSTPTPIQADAAITREVRTCAACGASGPQVQSRCERCVKHKVAMPVYYCNKACQEAHWPVHSDWHQRQRQLQKERERAGVYSEQRYVDHRAAQWIEDLERRGANASEYDRLIAAAMRKKEEKDYRGAFKACNQAMKLNPDDVLAYALLAMVHKQLGDYEKALTLELKVLELEPDKGGAKWCAHAAKTFDTLSGLPNAERPAWWNESQLLQISEKVASGNPDLPFGQIMRGQLLAGLSDGTWEAGPRSAASFRQAAIHFQRAARIYPNERDQAGFKSGAAEFIELAEAIERAGPAALGRWRGSPGSLEIVS